MPDYSPTFLKRDPVTGLMFYDFEGHIGAVGVDLKLSHNVVESDRRITWADTTRTPAHSFTGGVTNAPEGDGSTWHDVTLEDLTTAQFANLRLVLDNTTHRSSIECALSGNGGGTGATFLRNDGASDFLKLVSTQNWRMASDAVAMAFAANNDTTTVVNHGLGVVPRLIILTPQVGGTQAITFGVTARTVNTFTITASTWNRANATYNFGMDWLAIG